MISKDFKMHKNIFLVNGKAFLKKDKSFMRGIFTEFTSAKRRMA